MNPRSAFLAAIAAAGLTSVPVSADPNVLHEADIVFQVSRSAQSRAIQEATHSRFSHVGLVHLEKGQRFVVEAVGPRSGHRSPPGSLAAKTATSRSCD